jgi:hypothetical protein
MWLPRLNRRGGWTEWRRDNKWWHIILLLDYMSPSPSPSAQECAAAVAPPGCDPTPTGVGPSRRPARSERERRHVCERHSVKERMMGRQVAGISSSSGGSSSRRGRQAGAWWPPSRQQLRGGPRRGGLGGGGDTASCRLGVVTNVDTFGEPIDGRRIDASVGHRVLTPRKWPPSTQRRCFAVGGLCSSVHGPESGSFQTGNSYRCLTITLRLSRMKKSRPDKKKGGLCSYTAQPHSAPARPRPGPLSHIHRSIPHSQCGAVSSC